MSKVAQTTRGSTNSRSPTATAPAKPDSFRCTSSRECNPTAHGTTTAGSATRSSHSSPVLQSPPWPTPGGSPSGPASGEGCGQAEHPRGVRAWNTRDNSTVLVEELVSRGYVVATIDHTHDSSPVEFPDGRVEVSALPPNSPEAVAQAVAVRVADTHFVRDTLSASTPAATRTPSTGRFRMAWAAPGTCPRGACWAPPWAARPQPKRCSRIRGSGPASPPTAA